MLYLLVLLAGSIFALLGWPLAWLAVHGYRRVHDRVSAPRLRLLVMAFLGISPAVLVFLDEYFVAQTGFPTGTPPGRLLGTLFTVAGYPTGWMLTATVIELAIRSKRPGFQHRDHVQAFNTVAD